MARPRSLPMVDFDDWPSEDGWPYPDADVGTDGHHPADPAADVDEDLVTLHASGAHLLDGLDERQRAVLTLRFGLDGRPPRSLRELHRELGIPDAEAREALDAALSAVSIRLR